MVVVQLTVKARKFFHNVLSYFVHNRTDKYLLGGDTFVDYDLIPSSFLPGQH